MQGLHVCHHILPFYLMVAFGRIVKNVILALVDPFSFFLFPSVESSSLAIRNTGNFKVLLNRIFDLNLLLVPSSNICFQPNHPVIALH